jgi:hypothetical protein
MTRHNNSQPDHGAQPTSAVWRRAQNVSNGGCLCLTAPGHIGKVASYFRLNAMAGVVVRAGLGHHDGTVRISAQPLPTPMKLHNEYVDLKPDHMTKKKIMNTASKPGPHTQTDRGTCPGVGL